MIEQNIEYLSGDVREVLGKPPAAVTSWVFYITLFMFGLLLLAGFTFSFPKIIYGDLILSTAQAPSNVDAPKTGTIGIIKVKEGDIVSKDQLIAVFENDADIDDVLELENDLDQLNTLDVDAIRGFTPNRMLNLNQQLAVLYQDFITSLEFVPLYDGDGIDQDAINAIHAENNQIKRSNKNLENAILSAEVEIEAQNKLFTNTHEVFAEKPRQEELSNELFRIDEKRKSLQSQVLQIRSEIEKNNEKIKNNNSKMLQMRANQSTGTQERIFQLSQNISSLRKALSRWKEDNLVYAPANGQVYFYNNLALKKRYKKEEEFAAIIPVTENTEYIGLVKIPVEGSGKVKIGQAVNLKFSAYPFLTFGLVKGKVTKVYPLSQEDTFTVEVALVNGLITTHGQELNYQQQMKGDAEIITENKLFVSRLFEKVLSF